VDTEALMARHFAIAEWKKDKKRTITQVLRDLAQTKGLSKDELSSEEIKQVEEARKSLAKLEQPSYEVLGPWATMSIQAMREYQRTLTGLNDHSNLSEVLSALPKKHREIAAALIEHGSAKEKTKFFNLIPSLEQNALGAYLGINRNQIPEKVNLKDYFSNHYLPESDWEGWRPEINLQDLKTRSEDYQNLHLQRPSEARVRKAELMTYGVGVPISQHPTTGDLQGKLNDLLSGQGMENLNIQVSATPSKRATLSVNMNLEYDDHEKVLDEITERI
jgi:hypothetical protein